MIRSASFFWVTCDHEGCAYTCPGDKADIMAWETKDQALIAAEDEGWHCEELYSDADETWCPDHRPEVDDE